MARKNKRYEAAKERVVKQNKPKFKQLQAQIREQIDLIKESGIDTTDMPDLYVPRFNTKNVQRSFERGFERLHYLTEIVQNIKALETEQPLYTDWYYALTNWKAQLTVSYASNFPFVQYLIKWSNDIVKTYGEEEMGNMIIKAEEEGYTLTREILYNIDNAGIDYMNTLMSFLPPEQEITKQELIDIWESTEDTTWVEILRGLDY